MMSMEQISQYRSNVDETASNLLNIPEKQLVPEIKADRQRLILLVKNYVKQLSLIPPLHLEEIKSLAIQFIYRMKLPINMFNFIAVLINNAVWETTLAKIPYHRRILLLPQCLRKKESCPASMDEFGLLCEQCGGCQTGLIQKKAEEMGYVVLIAEGTTVVTQLLESGKVDAVIGVSCLSALERSFPYTVASAIPGMALPLLHDGCNNTRVDLDWLGEVLKIRSSGTWKGRIKIEEIQAEVARWFEPSSLHNILNLKKTLTEFLAYEWIIKGGKRWRPFLSSSVYAAIKGNLKKIPAAMQKLAIAVECFHKASLVHDDIEDDDDFRYGTSTLHKKHGIPIALNLGDLLIGEGYRLISECQIPPKWKAKILAVAAHGHRELCLGQGEELAWMRNPISISVDDVIKIFQRKTAPAFEVAMNLGALCAGADDSTCEILKSFSESLGIAYQIRDDIEDFNGGDMDSDIMAMRPSLILAMAFEYARNDIIIDLQTMNNNEIRTLISEAICETVTENKLVDKAWELFNHYKNEALQTLNPIMNPTLKGLLYRIVHKILKPPASNQKNIKEIHGTGVDPNKIIDKENFSDKERVV